MSKKREQRKAEARKRLGLSPEVTYINGRPYMGTITPVMDKIDKLNKRFIVDEDELSDLANTSPSPLDSYFLEVAEKHGIDMADADDYDGDE